MSRRALTNKELAQLQHVDEPCKILESWGFEREEAVETLWSLPTAEENPIPLTRNLTYKLFRSMPEASAQAKMAICQQLLSNTDANDYYEYESIEQGLRITTDLLENNAEEVLAALTELEAPLLGLITIQLIASGHLDTVSAEATPSVAQWWFRGNWRLDNIRSQIEDINALVDEDLWNDACLHLAEERAVLQQDQFSTELLERADDDALVNIAMQQDSENKALTAEIVKRGNGIIPQIEAQLLPIEPPQRYSNIRGAAVFSAYIKLLLAAERELPEELDAWFDYRLGQYSYGEETPYVMEVLQHIPEDRVRSLLEDNWMDGHICRNHFGAIKRPFVFRDAIRHLREQPPRSWYKDQYVEGFVLGGDMAVEAIVEALQEKQPTQLVTILSKSLKKLTSPASTEALRGLLQHSSKVVRKDAVAALSSRGEEGLQDLDKALLARKKATREAALQVYMAAPKSDLKETIRETVLASTKHDDIKAALEGRVAQVEGAEDTIMEIHALIESIDEETHAEMAKVSDNWYNVEDTESQKTLDRFGLSALLVNNLNDSWWCVDFWRAAIEHNIDNPLTPWIVVYYLTQLDDKNRSWRMDGLRQGVQLLGDKATEPLISLANRGGHQTLLLGCLADLATEDAAKTLAEGLNASKKSARSVAEQGLLKLGEAAIDTITPFLQAGKKPARLTAVSLLRSFASPDSVEALQAAYAKEKNAEVASALQDAISACQGEQPEALLSANTEELEALLRETHAIRLPKFFDASVLPPLTWSSGTPMSPEATQGWLYQLAKESDKEPNQTARVLREHINAEELNAFGKAVLREWNDNGRPTRHRWMRWQMGISASPMWLQEESRWLDKSDYITFGNHGSRLSALILHTTHPGWGKRKARELLTAAIEAIPEDANPTPEDIAMYRNELKDLDIQTHEFQRDLQYKEENEQDVTTWQIRATTFPEFATPTNDITVDLVDVALKEHTDPQLEAQLQRKAIVELKQLAHHVDKTYADVLSRAKRYKNQNQRWSSHGWKRLFQQHPLWQLCGLSLVFQTEEGQRFITDLDGNPIDDAGESVALSPDGFIYFSDPEQLSKAERKRWESALADKRQLWKEQQPEEAELQIDADPLLELRTLLYNEPNQDNWQAVCDLLESWPEDESLELALSYIEAHADEHWGTQRRVAPESWTLSLVEPNNQRRSRWESNNTPISDNTQERLRACNQLHFSYVNLRQADVKRLLNSPHIQHITGLELEGGRLYAGADERLFKGLNCPLTHFGIDGINIRDKGWPILFASEWMKDLTHLKLCGCDLDWQAIEKCLAQGIFDDLESLNIKNNRVALPGIQLLLEHEPLAGLKELTIAYDDLNEDGMLYFAEHNTFQELEVLNMRSPWYWSEEGVEGIRAISASDRFPKLKRIVLHEDDWYLQNPNHSWLDAIRESKTLPQAVLDYANETYPERTEEDE